VLSGLPDRNRACARRQTWSCKYAMWAYEGPCPRQVKIKTSINTRLTADFLSIS
jgi:hypothetical protein